MYQNKSRGTVPQKQLDMLCNTFPGYAGYLFLDEDHSRTFFKDIFQSVIIVRHDDKPGLESWLEIVPELLCLGCVRYE